MPLLCKMIVSNDRVKDSKIFTQKEGWVFLTYINQDSVHTTTCVSAPAVDVFKRLQLEDLTTRADDLLVSIVVFKLNCMSLDIIILL